MYATAVGLVLKGIAEQQKPHVVSNQKKADNDTDESEKGRKDPRQGTWFDFFFQKGKELIKDEGEDKKL
jgi:cell division ATPase FtsA